MPNKNIRQHSFMNHTNTAKVMSVIYTSLNKIIHNISCIYNYNNNGHDLKYKTAAWTYIINNNFTRK